MFYTRAIVVLFSFGSLLGCGDDGGTSDAGTDASDSMVVSDDFVEGGRLVEAGQDAKVYDPITLEAFCEQWRDAAREVSCAGVSDEECQSILNNEGAKRCQTIAESISSGRSSFDGAEAARCLAETDKATLAQGYEFGFIANCNVVTGNVANGADCYYESAFGTDECANGYCDREVGCPGTCKAFQPRGETCNTELRCASDDYCKRDCTPPCDGTCEARPAEGDECEFLCQSGLICSPTTNTCIRIKPEGRSCALDEECEQGFCRGEVCQKVANAKGEACRSNENCPDALICDFTQGNTCQDRIALGETCPAGNDVCEDDGVCATPLLGGDTTCVASLGRDGDPCTYLCEEDHFCSTEDDNQVCRADRGQGEDCSTNTAISGTINLPCQAGLHCMESSTETCLPPGKLDEPCFYNRTETCEAGLWCTIAGSKCIEPATGDELCYSNWSDACLSTHYCGTAGGTRAGWGSDTCLPKQALDQPCLEDVICESGICLRESEDDELGTCASERPVVQPDRCVPS